MPNLDGRTISDRKVSTSRPGREPDYNPDAEFAQVHPVRALGYSAGEIAAVEAQRQREESDAEWAAATGQENPRIAPLMNEVLTGLKTEIATLARELGTLDRCADKAAEIANRRWVDGAAHSQHIQAMTDLRYSVDRAHRAMKVALDDVERAINTQNMKADRTVPVDS